MPTKSELAFAAGFIEGEGSFHLQGKRGRRTNFVVSVSQVQREPLDRMKLWFGGSICRCEGQNRKNPKWSVYFRWQLTGERARVLVDELRKWLSPRRRAQIDTLFARRQAILPPHNATKTHCVRGHELAGDNLYLYPDGRRECRTCSRGYKTQYRRKVGHLPTSTTVQ